MFMLNGHLFLMGNGATSRCCDHLQQTRNIAGITVGHFLQGSQIRFGAYGSGILHEYFGFAYQPMGTENDKYSADQDNNKDGVVDLRMGIAEYRSFDRIKKYGRPNEQQSKRQ